MVLRRYSPVPAQCWFPLLVLMASMASRHAGKRRKKCKVRIFRNQTMSSVSQSAQVQSQSSSVVPSSNVANSGIRSWIPREKVLSQEEIDLNQKLSDACHKCIYDFLPLSAIPRTASCVGLVLFLHKFQTSNQNTVKQNIPALASGVLALQRMKRKSGSRLSSMTSYVQMPWSTTVVLKRCGPESLAAAILC